MLGLMGRLDNFRALGYRLGFVFVTAVLPPVTGLVTACVTLTRQVDDPIGMMPVPAVITPVGTLSAANTLPFHTFGALHTTTPIPATTSCTLRINRGLS